MIILYEKSNEGNVTYKDLRDLILEEGLEEGDTIILNPKDFLEVDNEVFSTYGSYIEHPHLLLSVLICEARSENVPIGNIGVFRLKQKRVYVESEYLNDGIFYMCTSCGSVFEGNGNFLSDYEAKRKMRSTLYQRIIKKEVCDKCRFNNRTF